jgi:putative endonuclease
MKKGYLYILECSDGTFYTGSTIDLDKRMKEHQEGKGANHTKKRLPVRLVYFEEFTTIGQAFRKEKQIQGWSRSKKKALIKENFGELKKLAECQNESHHMWFRLRSTTEFDLNE